ncbi:VWA domain-containing protein [Acinetobacter faecalis]|uniref:vWA domain-containing protein n=1 Tax=Acinetobacter faecalis TaxID=2665161 RepID=UPI002A91B3C3|nr:VWA domain-containing protein [Acinetobacter faecalis]MDY6481919.1 VWA domain-containing protein [Acinetobacter faecalis]
MKNKKLCVFGVLSLFITACGQQPRLQEGGSSARMLQRSALPAQLGIANIANSPSLTSKHLDQYSLNTEKYQKNVINPVKRVAEDAVSTFSIDVDTGSYTNVRRYLQRQTRLPPVDAIRIEEMINYFNYDYPQVKSEHPFTLNTEVVASPWKQNAKLIRIGIKANDIEYAQLPAANLVFLVDVSGSMAGKSGLELVKKTLKILTEQLRTQDRVTIVTYSGREEIALETTSGKDKWKILKVIDSLEANGATSGESAIRMAYDLAEKSFIKNGINRILIATDGDFNVGVTDFDTLKGMVEEKRKTGISLTTLGYGVDNYNEHLMEQMADAGDGNYSYIDNEKEALKVVERQLSSTLATVAQDVKIQVEFNPTTVKEYRLVGYENRVLKEEDFNNDQVDAGDIGAGHTVTALYEIIPTGVGGWMSDSRYQKNAQDNSNSNEYAFLKLRYKLPNQQKSILINQPIENVSKSFDQASKDTQWAVAVTSYAELLRGGKYIGNMNWAKVLDLANKNAKPDPYLMKAEFIELVETAQKFSSNRGRD